MHPPILSPCPRCGAKPPNIYYTDDDELYCIQCAYTRYPLSPRRASLITSTLTDRAGHTHRERRRMKHDPHDVGPRVTPYRGQVVQLAVSVRGPGRPKKVPPPTLVEVEYFEEGRMAFPTNIRGALPWHLPGSGVWDKLKRRFREETGLLLTHLPDYIAGRNGSAVSGAAG